MIRNYKEDVTSIKGEDLLFINQNYHQTADQSMSFYISLVNSILALIMMFYNWRINRSSIFLGLLILFISSYSIVGYIVTYSQSRYLIAISFGHLAPLWYLSPPLLYLYVRSIIEDRVKLRWLDFIHLIPFIISLVGLFPYLILPFQSKLNFADEIIKNINAPKYIQTDWIVPFEYKLLLKPILMLFYSILSILMILRAKKRYASSPLIPKNQWEFIQKWMFLITSTFIIMSVPALLISFQYNGDNNIDPSLIRNSLFFYMIGLTQLLLLLLMILFPQIIYGIPIISRRDIENDSVIQHDINIPIVDNQYVNDQPASYVKDEKINPDPFLELGKMILTVMEEKKPFLNVDFSLDDLAEILQVPKHHLYYCFQNILSKKFTKLRTEYRIEYAKKLLLESDFRRVTLDSIGQDAGFASKSSFYSVFKSEVGSSPGEFAKANSSLTQLSV